MSGFKTHHNPWDESCINESVNDENGRVAAIERRSRYRFRVAGIQQNGLKKKEINFCKKIILGVKCNTFCNDM